MEWLVAIALEILLIVYAHSIGHSEAHKPLLGKYVSPTRLNNLDRF